MGSRSVEGVIFTVICSRSAQIIAAQEEMLRKERELEEARKKLAQIRQQQYKFLPTELREDEGWLAERMWKCGRRADETPRVTGGAVADARLAALLSYNRGAYSTWKQACLMRKRKKKTSACAL